MREMREMMISNLFDLTGKFALVTGCYGNLGPIWLETLQSAGADVFGIDLKGCTFRVKGEEIFSDTSSLKYDFDITNPLNVEAIRQFFKIFGVFPDIIVNNAAIDHPPAPGVDFWTEFADIINTNLIGAIRVTKEFIPEMIKKESGVVVNIGSIQGNVGADWRNYEPGFEKPVGYNLSKAGLAQFTRSLAVQYGRYGIRSICISFAAVDTGKFTEPFASKFRGCMPLGRFISRESLEATLLYACCCPELTGQQILVDSGYTAW